MRIRAALPADCPALGLVTVTASLSAFIGVIPEELLDLSWTPAASAQGWLDGFARNTDRGQLFRVAEIDGQVAGFIWAQPWAATAGYDSCVKGLYVRPTHQRQGVGRALLGDAALLLGRQGLRSVEIGCVRENPSCGFYLQLGGIEIGTRPVRVDRFDTEEILFGWPDLKMLIPH